MDRHRGRHHRVDGVALSRPARIDAEHLAETLAGQRRSGNQAIDVITLQSGVIECALEGERCIAVGVAVDDLVARAPIVLRVIGIADTGDRGDA